MCIVLKAEDGTETPGTTLPFWRRAHCVWEAGCVTAGPIEANPLEGASPDSAVFLGYMNRETEG